MSASRRNSYTIGAHPKSRAVISVIERGRRHTEARISSRLFSATLMTVFFVLMLTALAAGATMLRPIVDNQLKANKLHLQAGLISNLIREGDIAGAVHEGDGPEGPALVFERTLESGTYETRIYHYQGKVMQELAMASRPYDPASATPLLETDAFSFEIADGLVRFTCDQGTFVVALRSDAGGGR